MAGGGSFSNEGRIDAGLRFFNCSGRAFAQIAQELGIKISLATFAAKLSGGSFDQRTAERLLEVLEQMRELQTAINETAKAHVAIDWNKVDHVVSALKLRQIQKIALEDGDHRFDRMAQVATDALRPVRSARP